jgi:hypothetical protein
VTSAVASYDHLYRLSDAVGIFEHAKGTTPRPEHGYCVDDMARALQVTLREPQPTPRLAALTQKCFRFVLDAQADDGSFHNRYAVGQGWRDSTRVADWWGRALWGLGTAFARAPHFTEEALDRFERGAVQRSPYRRSMAFAALGAAEVLSRLPDHAPARALLRDAAVAVGGPGRDPEWRWPEPRLSYANAVLAETLLAAGSMLGQATWMANGLLMLQWLVQVETAPGDGTDGTGGHLSVTPVGGWQLGQPRPAFDQQPIEVATLADASVRAYALSGEFRWREVVRRCHAWFLGFNDVGVPMLDPLTGGGFDGLEADGRNANQGAESTLALISTVQHASRLMEMTRDGPFQDFRRRAP